MDKQPLQLIRRLASNGNGYTFRVPKNYVKDGILKPGKIYALLISDIPETPPQSEGVA